MVKPIIARLNTKEKRLSKMVRCPHCGSTAQVKLSPTASLSRNKAWLILGCECGCGCHFTVDYNINDYDEAFVEYIEKR